MSYQFGAYDEPDVGFGPEPVVVLVVKGTHDVSRLVHTLNGAPPVVEQAQLAGRIVEAVRRHAGGRAALRLLAQHGGADFTPRSLPGITDEVLDALRQMLAGRLVKQIARDQSQSAAAVTMRLKRARERVGIQTNAQLMAVCVACGLLDAPEVGS